MPELNKFRPKMLFLEPEINSTKSRKPKVWTKKRKNNPLKKED
jgi:hypothetical protein